MTTDACNTSKLSSWYKLDHVLYEIRDQRGILKNYTYESWKAEVIIELESLGFIKPDGDKYVITEEGREVIHQDSFLRYNCKLKNKTEDAILDLIEGRSSKFWSYLLGLSLLFVTLLVAGTKLQLLAFLF
ncbi:hypothetical protein LZ575_12630 [Antarcticibacterium sp. 1MA-6-2]|uniref:hypothetical protein n=1 Tax=Antarcticibacterium sp. 1MA-6-2 TaxID=2908210 RepID=UPI001F236B86|nr:hypothetical protein [Antarcticibacterium sp. 1MA-6-2]UJH89845.1 hypothetical protein LZ575_12630 [Antarcticibacterium sp. 1MA-6-2]